MSSSEQPLVGVDRGEATALDHRIVTAPAAGRFVPVPMIAAKVNVGDIVGTISTLTADVPVVSPFAGRVVEMTARPGERMMPYDRVCVLEISQD